MHVWMCTWMLCGSESGYPLQLSQHTKLAHHTLLSTYVRNNYTAVTTHLLSHHIPLSLHVWNYYTAVTTHSCHNTPSYQIPHLSYPHIWDNYTAITTHNCHIIPSYPMFGLSIQLSQHKAVTPHTYCTLIFTVTSHCDRTSCRQHSHT